jgi:ankyrin repeat protein
LHDAQFTIAREHGFESWPKLVAHLEQLLGAELLAAAESGDVARVREILRESPHLKGHHVAYQKTPLHLAAEKDHAAIAEQLLSVGAELEAEASWGMTPLAWAANMGSNKVGELLLARGARSNLWIDSGLGLLERVRAWWTAEGALRPGAGQAHYPEIAKNEYQKAPPPSDERTIVSDAFYIACRNGHAEVARFLLERGADIDYRGHLGGTGLHWAAGNGHHEVVEILIAHGARRDLQDQEFHATPQAWATHGGHAALAELLD